MIEFTVPALSCQHCVQAVTEAVHIADPQARVDVDLATKRVQVDTTAQRDALIARLSDAGYPPS